MRTTSALTTGAAALLLAVVVVAGCASTEVTKHQRYQGAQLARPDRIIVHDFTGNPADVPPESAFAASANTGSYTVWPFSSQVCPICPDPSTDGPLHSPCTNIHPLEGAQAHA
jgi:hypothetical protein